MSRQQGSEKVTQQRKHEVSAGRCLADSITAGQEHAQANVGLEKDGNSVCEVSAGFGSPFQARSLSYALVSSRATSLYVRSVLLD